MGFTNKDILFASLVGSDMVKILPRFNTLENELAKHVLPSVSILPLASEVWQADRPQNEEDQFFPLSFSLDEEATWFTLPYEPIINITGKNNIVKRNVAKWHPEISKDYKGTIKERWSQDDYDIEITGFLMGSMLRGNMEDCFPKKDFEKLRTILTSSLNIRIKCPPLELLGIHYIVIEDFKFPFTKGENVQAYSIKAVSDFSYNLLIKEKDA